MQHVTSLKNTYKTTNNVFVLFGDDFANENAFATYLNLDNLIEMVNESPNYNS